MPQAEQHKEYLTFVQGLITEASPLTFPENASVDEDNFILNRDGSRRRRKGMTYEQSAFKQSFGLNASTVPNASLSTYKWDNVDGDPSLTIGIIQTGQFLWFIDLTKSSPSAAASQLNQGSSPVYMTIPETSGNTVLDYATINGEVVITCTDMQPYRIKYNSTSDVFTSTLIELEVRDIWGTDSEQEVDSLTICIDPNSNTGLNHIYNLHNQGWTKAHIITYYAAYPGTCASGYSGYYPNDTMIWTYGKNSSDVFSPSLLRKQDFGTTFAPKGRNIMSFFDRDADRTAWINELYGTAYGSIGGETEEGRFATVAAYAGRIFYAGLQSSVPDTFDPTLRYYAPTSTGVVLFSQANLSKNDDAGKCYQEADPTAEIIADIVDTDGGTIVIPESGNILKLLPIGNSLVVVAENGVWQVSGAEGFKATNYEITKVSSVGATSARSIVSAEGVGFYWSSGGIYVLTPNDQTGRLVAQNLTETTIQTFYSEISSPGREHAVGDYDEATKKVAWLYNDTSAYDGITNRQMFNRELIFDTVLGAFYTSTINDRANDTESPYLAGYMPLANYTLTEFLDPVTVAGVAVTEGAGANPVTVPDTARTAAVTDRKYLVIKPNSGTTDYQYTLGEFTKTSFLDWENAGETEDGISYESYIVTGHELLGDSARDKQGRYLTMHFGRTENNWVDDGSGNSEFDFPSSCNLQTRWEWSDSSAGRWGNTFQAYRFVRPFIPGAIGTAFDYGQEVITTKNKIRGKGKALSFKLSSEAGKDMYVLGWAISYTGTTRV